MGAPVTMGPMDSVYGQASSVASALMSMRRLKAEEAREASKQKDTMARRTMMVMMMLMMMMMIFDISKPNCKTPTVLLYPQENLTFFSKIQHGYPPIWPCLV